MGGLLRHSRPRGEGMAGPRTAARKCGGTTSNGGIALSGSARSGCSGVGTYDLALHPLPRCAADGVSRPQSFAAPAKRWTGSPSSMNSPTAWAWFSGRRLTTWWYGPLLGRGLNYSAFVAGIACHSWAPAFPATCGSGWSGSSGSLAAPGDSDPLFLSSLSSRFLTGQSAATRLGRDSRMPKPGRLSLPCTASRHSRRRGARSP